MRTKVWYGYFGLILILCWCFTVSAHAQDWPLHNAQWAIVIEKDINTNPPPHEPFDLPWMHLHRGHPTLADALSNTLAPTIVNGATELDPSDSGIQLRYLVKNIPVSDWLDPPFRFELKIDNPALAQLQDGVHDLSVDVRGASRADFKPRRGFVHLSRDLSDGEPFGFIRDVPIVNSRQSTSNAQPHFGPGVVYVNPDERNHVAFPVSPDVTPWQQPPLEASLYQEQMGPHTELFHAVQMWWEHIAHPDAPYVRGMTPQHGEDHRFLRVQDKHERFPMTDGPRGIGWMSPYISGQVDSQGRFAFAEAGGRIGYMMPDGEIITVAGWRVHPDKDPLWWEKPTEQVRQNMQLRGNWLSGRGEFFTPLDIAIDPKDESIWYVVSYEDHVVWKVELPEDLKTQEATISVFAGDPDHSAGSADGNGQQARFNGPSSIVFDPVNDVLYVADQENDAIRRITRSGEVSTPFGKPGTRQSIESQGIDIYDQLASRSVSVIEVSQEQAAQGVRPDIYMPQAIRVDSKGNLILLELGYGAIRRIDPLTGVTETLGEVRQKHRQFSRGWAWLDVDRYGNAGPLDGIYWCKFVSTLPGEMFNEVFSWLPPDGGESVALFPRETGLYPDGWGQRGATNAPHYPWLVAVDPRGALLMAGGGEHGVTRLRVQKDDDPIQGQDYWLGRHVWESGSDAEGSYAANSFALKYGYGGQNYLGMTNAWSLDGADDEQLLDAFDAPASLRNDAVSRQHWLDFIRPNTHYNGELPDDPPPEPETTPTIVSPAANASLAGDIETFTWQNNGVDAQNYWLYLGSSVGAPDYFNSGNRGTDVSVIAYGLPSDGTTPVYARLWYQIAGIGEWLYIDEVYTAGTDTSGTPTITSLLASGDLTSLNGIENLTWTHNAPDATDYWVYAGSERGGSQYFNSGNLPAATSVSMTGMPIDGTNVWIRLWYRFGGNGNWLYVDQENTAVDALPVITASGGNNVLNSPNDTFSWTDPSNSVTSWWLYVGSDVGGNQYENSGNLFGAKSYTTVNGNLPNGDVPVHVRLWFQLGDGSPWQFTDVVFSSAP